MKKLNLIIVLLLLFSLTSVSAIQTIKDGDTGRLVINVEKIQPGLQSIIQLFTITPSTGSGRTGQLVEFEIQQSFSRPFFGYGNTIIEIDGVDVSFYRKFIEQIEDHCSPSSSSCNLLFDVSWVPPSGMEGTYEISARSKSKDGHTLQYDEITFIVTSGSGGGGGGGPCPDTRSYEYCGTDDRTACLPNGDELPCPLGYTCEGETDPILCHPDEPDDPNCLPRRSGFYCSNDGLAICEFGVISSTCVGGTCTTNDFGVTQCQDDDPPPPGDSACQPEQFGEYCGNDGKTVCNFGERIGYCSGNEICQETGSFTFCDEPDETDPECEPEQAGSYCSSIDEHVRCYEGSVNGLCFGETVCEENSQGTFCQGTDPICNNGRSGVSCSDVDNKAICEEGLLIGFCGGNEKCFDKGFGTVECEIVETGDDDEEPPDNSLTCSTAKVLCAGGLGSAVSCDFYQRNCQGDPTDPPTGNEENAGIILQAQTAYPADRVEFLTTADLEKAVCFENAQCTHISGAECISLKALKAKGYVSDEKANTLAGQVVNWIGKGCVVLGAASGAACLAVTGPVGGVVCGIAGCFAGDVQQSIGDKLSKVWDFFKGKEDEEAVGICVTDFSTSGAGGGNLFGGDFKGTFGKGFKGLADLIGISPTVLLIGIIILVLLLFIRR